MSSSYSSFTVSQTAVLITPAWTGIVIPAGSIDATISMEDLTISFYVASAGGGGATDGVPIAAGGSYVFPGEAAAAVTVYVCPSAATNAVLQVQA